MKYFIVAGEASGDLHGSNLAKHLILNDSHAVIQAWGGDRMSQQGVEVKKHIRELAFMGFVEVLLNIRTILRNFETCKSQIEAFAPDALILIDYPGFNMRLAKWANKKKIKTITPKIGDVEYLFDQGKITYLCRGSADKSKPRWIH